ncbi:DUF6463 family protein [Kibdelosporangium aridum]|uniref:DUF6463 family protein n=1 Tax=Kibdelosporangium aridum TaxID=2030 RepID=UPI00163BD2F6|nr:DUF6463 family protein [Kibdelosporangium aridum]
MSIETVSSVSRRTLWAGRLMVIIAAVHLVGFGVASVDAVPEWLGGALWFKGLTPIPEAEGLFWASIGSFAVPVLILGLVVGWLAKQGLPVPRFVPWILGAWVLVCSLLMEPSGFPLGLIPVGMLLVRP